MRIHLFGLPISLHRRLKADSSGWQGAVPAGHDFRASPAHSNELAALSDSELREIESGVNEGFTHIVLPANRKWAHVRKFFQFDCRVHIARLREPLRDLTWPILQDSIHTIAHLDEGWLQRFCPRDLKHPLLLPPPIFATKMPFWMECDVYTTDRFETAESLLEEVKREHRRPDGSGRLGWLDSRGRRFRVDPSMHGPSVSDRAGRRSYRFCFEVPSGFHYDVTHDSGRYFKMEIDGQLQQVTHCNVTPWGSVRRGKEA